MRPREDSGAVFPARAGVARGPMRCAIGRALRGVVFAAVLAIPMAASVGSLHAQNTDARLRQQQQQLDRLRREREELEQRMTTLQRSARSLAEEMQNLDRQAAATARLVEALDAQLVEITARVDSATGELVRAEDELAAKRAVLRRRTIDIYKRGPLFEAEALLSARSLGELLARYKYLHEVAARDQELATGVETLRDEIASKRGLLVRLQEEIGRNRAEQSGEADRLRRLEQQRARRLASVQQDADATRQRLRQLARDEARIASVLRDLETARRRAELAPNAAAPRASSITTADLGNLDWPVDGEILYRFGRVVNPNNTTTRWNGLGIAARFGTTVRSVAAGDVVLAEQIGTYGLTIIVQHGGGDYSVYGSLAEASVRAGQRVTKGQTIGTIGSADPALPPHLHFEIRPKGRAVDPLEWLKRQER